MQRKSGKIIIELLRPDAEILEVRYLKYWVGSHHPLFEENLSPSLSVGWPGADWGVAAAKSLQTGELVRPNP